MKDRENIYFCLDFGSHRIRLTGMRFALGETVEVFVHEEIISDGISRGEIKDVKIVEKLFKNLIKKVEKEHSQQIHSLYAAVNNPSFSSQNKTASISIELGNEVNHFHVQELEKKIISEPKDWLHYIKQGFSLDGKSYENILGLKGEELRVDFHCIPKKHSFMNDLGMLSKNLNIEIIPVFSGLVMTHAIFPNKREKTGIFLNIGHSSTVYIFYYQGCALASGTLPLGGEHVTNDISVVKNIPFSEAESLKKTADLSFFLEEEGQKELEHSSVSCIAFLRMKEIFEVCFQQIQKKLKEVPDYIPENFSSSSNLKIFLAGGGASIQGCEKLASSVFNIPASLQKEFNTITLIGLMRYIEWKQLQKPKEGFISRLANHIKDYL